METKEEYKEIEPKESNGGSTYVSSPQPLKGTNAEEDEIDLIELLQQLWKGRKVILYSVIAALTLGLFIAIVSPEEYTSEIVLMPQAASGRGGTDGLLQRLGGFAGISLGGGSPGTLSAELYPEITNSTACYLNIMQQPLYFSTLDTTMTLQHYFTKVSTPTLTDYLKQYTLGLPRMLIRLPLRLANLFEKPKPQPPNLISETTSQDSVKIDTLPVAYQPITVNNQERATVARLQGRITTSIEPNGLVRVSTTMPDPLVAAHTNELAVEYLTNYITDYRVEKVQQDLSFIEKQFEEKQQRYKQAQQQLAILRDRNANLVTESARIELERAQTEYNLAFGLYQSVAQQLEQAQVRVQEETPVFRVLEPIQVSYQPSAPNKEAIITLAILGGLVLGIGIILTRFVYSKLKVKL